MEGAYGKASLKRRCLIQVLKVDKEPAMGNAVVSGYFCLTALDISPNAPRSQVASPVPSPYYTPLPVFMTSGDATPVHQALSPDPCSPPAPSLSLITRSCCHQSSGATTPPSQPQAASTCHQLLQYSPDRLPFSIFHYPSCSSFFLIQCSFFVN